MGTIKIIMISVCLIVVGAGAAMAATDGEPSVMVYFDSGKDYLSATEKAKLRTLFQTYDVSGAGRVFVLGFTDSQGAQEENFALSQKRAQSVRREIISSFGVDATVVMALGKGAENPLADNKQGPGRALNRRAEIYLANAVPRRPQRRYGPHDPHLARITALVDQADADVRARRFDQALNRLEQAHAVGGDHYSDWHMVMGIAGFYAGAPSDKVKAHLTTAVQLDPFNFKARDFLSRLDARHQVATGKVTPQTGRRPEDAIPVTAVVQVYEYLTLFGVEPVNHHEMADKPMDVWNCLDAKGQSVAYYFSHAPVYAWIYAQQAAPVTPPAARVQRPHQSAGPLPGQFKPEKAALNEPGPQPPATEKPPQIWESRLFQ